MPVNDTSGGDSSPTSLPPDVETPEVGKVALSGSLEGPFTVDFNAGDGTQDTAYRYRLRRTSDPNQYVDVAWWDIRWIDDYPHPPYNEQDGNTPAALGLRTLWVDEDLHLKPGNFLAGQIAQDYLPTVDTAPIIGAWRDEQKRRYFQGTYENCLSSKPPCMCTTKPAYSPVDLPPIPNMPPMDI